MTTKAEDIKSWAKRKAKDFKDPAISGKVLVKEELPFLVGELSQAAPRRSGALSKSFYQSGFAVESSLPYALKIDRGGVIVAKGRDMVIPLVPGYRASSAGYATVTTRTGRAVVRRGTHDFVALRRRTVVIRARPYLEKAYTAWMADSEQRIAAKLEKAGL